jgi:hypothetical protein
MSLIALDDILLGLILIDELYLTLCPFLVILLIIRVIKSDTFRLYNFIFMKSLEFNVKIIILWLFSLM